MWLIIGLYADQVSVQPLALKALNCFKKLWRPKGFIQFETIIHVTDHIVLITPLQEITQANS